MPYAGNTFYVVSRGAEERRGKGSFPLVLIHGAGGSRLNWPAELRRLGQARLSGVTVYTLDLPGHGRSSGGGRGAIEDYAVDIVALFDAVGIERSVVVGHSMGGAIALTMALDSPERVVGLVLIATGARLRVALSILERISADFEAALGIILLDRAHFRRAARNRRGRRSHGDVGASGRSGRCRPRVPGKQKALTTR